MMLATAIMLVFVVLEAFQVLKSTYLLDELFFTTYGLYFGRRIQLKGNNLDLGPKEPNIDCEHP